MKTLVVYYSLEGNTEFLANMIAKEIGADILKLQPQKEVSKNGFMKYLWGGKSVAFNEKPKLINEFPDLSQYSHIYIGTPIWNNSFVPPINTFLAEQPIAGKKISLFACHGGGGTKKCFDKLKQNLSGNDIIKTIDFCNPLKLDKTTVEDQIKKWLYNEKV